MEKTSDRDLDRRLGARLKQARQQRGLTLDALAESTGVSRAMISRVERGESSPTAALLMKLGGGLDLTPSFLFADAHHAGPIARLSDQPGFRDPESGYLRRNVSPPGTGSAVEITEVVTPAGARILIDRPAGRSVLDQQVWIFEGVLELSLRGETSRLQAGDCMHMLIDGPIVFHNPGDCPARYAVIVSLRDGSSPGHRP